MLDMSLLLLVAAESASMVLNDMASVPELELPAMLADLFGSGTPSAPTDFVEAVNSDSEALRAAALFSRSMVLRLRHPFGLPARADVL
jgi:hypothetical protein